MSRYFHNKNQEKNLGKKNSRRLAPCFLAKSEWGEGGPGWGRDEKMRQQDTLSLLQLRASPQSYREIKIVCPEAKGAKVISVGSEGVPGTTALPRRGSHFSCPCASQYWEDWCFSLYLVNNCTSSVSHLMCLMAPTSHDMWLLVMGWVVCSQIDVLKS